MSNRNTSQIAKNSVVLFVKTFIVLIISLYTSRVILAVLGIIDYGIFNVVGGVIGMMTFLNSSMASTYQRYFNYEMGKGNEINLKNLFQSSITVQIIYSVIIIIVAETIGLWFLNNKLLIPADRLYAANIVYHSSLIILLISSLQVPFTALIISYERMSIFAFMSLLDVILKLIIVFLLPLLIYDRLIMYGMFMVLIIFLQLLLYVIICRRKFSTCVIGLNLSLSNIKSLVCFGGLSMVGTLAYTLKSQGLNIVLNLFFNPVVNAARGISYQIFNAVNQFISSFQTSIRPQLVKSYASGEIEYMYNLYYSSTKMSCYLFWCIALPILVETPLILKLWLGDNIPEYTVIFSRLMLLTLLVSAYANPTSCIAYATGRIKTFTAWVSSLNLLIVPIAYIVLRMGYGPSSAFIVSLIFTILVQAVRVVVLKKMINSSIIDYIKCVVLPTIGVFIMSSIIPIWLKCILNNTLINSLFIGVVSVISVIVAIWTIGLNKKEKSFVVQIIKKYSKKKNETYQSSG